MITQMKANTSEKTFFFWLPPRTKLKRETWKKESRKERERVRELEGLSDKAEALVEWMSYWNRGWGNASGMKRQVKW